MFFSSLLSKDRMLCRWILLREPNFQEMVVNWVLRNWTGNCKPLSEESLEKITLKGELHVQILVLCAFLSTLWYHQLWGYSLWGYSLWVYYKLIWFGFYLSLFHLPRFPTGTHLAARTLDLWHFILMESWGYSDFILWLYLSIYFLRLGLTM